MSRTTFMVALSLAMTPLAGHAQQPDAEARLQAALNAAAQAAVPVELLRSKIEEGRAKGVPAARIASAVEVRLQALIRARRTLAGSKARGVTAGELSLAADALQAGVSEAAVGHVIANAPPGRRAVATAVLTELVQMGMASESALARVNAALEKGGGALVNLPAQASGRARARGVGRNRGPGAVGGPPAEIEAGVHGGVDANIGKGRDRGRNDNPGTAPIELP